MSGVLYVVATPIGNLGDLTARAADTLRQADRIVAEDTRRTRALLTHLGIRGKPLVRLDAHSGPAPVERLVERLRAGESLALVTDAGTPAVSDPGPALVRSAAEVGVTVTVIPGPSALTAALAASGLVDGPFFFQGFLPRKGARRREALERIAALAEPVVLFEAPGRVRATLADLAAATPERPACVARELTKLHEELVRGSLAELAARDEPWRGEVTLVLGAQLAREAVAPAARSGLDDDIARRMAAGEPVKHIASEVAREHGLPRRLVYERVLSAREKNG